MERQITLTIAEAEARWSWPDSRAYSSRHMVIGKKARKNARKYIDVHHMVNGMYRLYMYGGTPHYDVPGDTIVTVTPY